MKFVIIGGSGLIGKKLAALLQQAGHQVLAASPSSGVNAVTGEGLSAALAGAEVVVDVSNSPSFEDDAVMAFFQSSTRNLLAAERAAGVRHHVVLSVVGAERGSDSGYLRAKLAQEDIIQGSTLPYTIVRATQFYEFLASIAHFYTQGQTVRVSSAKLQPIAADDVAAALMKVATEAPLNTTREVAGPQALPLDELLRRTLQARQDPREVVRDDDVLYFGARLDDGTLTAGPQAWIGPVSLDSWLARNAAN
ncbi:SDR family oxidoreductase [Aquabacterium sp.]|uniref:SDR family oxidoreductase n=1 Tax=Aquabacterium sp. TaxID=1872578 RepID=UPI002CBAA819|nr:SDR family oxidoreductase [Aquabacterium sp.]HSV71334.1 SDR family oxidoreductase [Methylibium sp.]HSW06471.1 SDR family oxidoreductase [Aquabacterium sp.]